MYMYLSGNDRKIRYFRARRYLETGRQGRQNGRHSSFYVQIALSNAILWADPRFEFFDLPSREDSAIPLF